jgi:osmotically-inducible protein OsmY
MLAAGIIAFGAFPAVADDAETRTQIEQRLQDKGLLEDADVKVAVVGGEATLSGVVTNLPLSREIAKQARKEAEVVHNELRVFIEEPVADREIVEGIRDAVLGYPYYQVFDHVEFGVEKGNVLLVGSVIQPWKKSIIEERVARVDGVRAIQNDITVQSMSQFDSDLRRTLARRIYGDARFAQYAYRAQPPIRILVDRGNVTLAGWVGSPVEKAILDSIARSTLSFNVENLVRVDGEVPEEDKKQEENT